MTDPETALRAILPDARRIARQYGERHPLWLAIFDAQSVLADEPTKVRFGSRDEAVERLLALLRSYVG